MFEKMIKVLALILMSKNYNTGVQAPHIFDDLTQEGSTYSDARLL